MIDGGDLAELERRVGAALATGDPSELHLLGHGEISLVVGWPTEEPIVACKRLPPFRDAGAFARYAAVVERYIDALRAAGVRVVDTELRSLRRPDGTVIGFHVQPAHPAERLATELLRSGDPARGHPVVAAVVDTVATVTSDRLGVDAQLSNWLWLDGEPWQLDLTTPFLLDRHGRLEFELTPFLAALPAVTRPVVRRQMTQLVQRWTTARGALADMAANILKERLDPWLDPVLAEVNRRVDPAVTPGEASAVHTSDAQLWPLLLRLERANRWWQRRVRRRPYEFLLPTRTTYEEEHPGGVTPTLG